MNNTILIIIIVVCVLLSAFFSMSEITFSGADKFKLQSNMEKNPKKYRITKKVYDHFDDTISTILVGNNLVNIAASSAATILFINIVGNESLGTTLATIILTVIILIFGEILPKFIGNSFANSLTVVLALPIKILEYVFKFITWPVNKVIGAIIKKFYSDEDNVSLTDEELIDIVDQIEDQGNMDEDKSDLIRNAIEFKDTTAYDVMIPRVDMIAFDIADDVHLFKKNRELLSHTIIPVYEDTIDNIIGAVDTKDVMKLLYLKKKFKIKDILKEVIYVNETKRIDDILRELHATRAKMCIVVDEFGGTDGILTREDILEELVGEIWDEKDKVEPEYKEINDNEFIVDGDMNIYDMFDLVEYDSVNFESEYSTVGGWISEVLDDLPEKGNNFTFENLEVHVLSVDDNRVEKVKIIRKIKEIDEENVD